MKTERYQFLAIVAVFTFGFFSHDLFHGNENSDDVYYQDELETPQCTVNIDCDNVYDRTVLFPGETNLEIHEITRISRKIKIS